MTIITGNLNGVFRLGWSLHSLTLAMQWSVCFARPMGPMRAAKSPDRWCSSSRFRCSTGHQLTFRRHSLLLRLSHPVQIKSIHDDGDNQIHILVTLTQIMLTVLNAYCSSGTLGLHRPQQKLKQQQKQQQVGATRSATASAIAHNKKVVADVEYDKDD